MYSTHVFVYIIISYCWLNLVKTFCKLGSHSSACWWQGCSVQCIYHEEQLLERLRWSYVHQLCVFAILTNLPCLDPSASMYRSETPTCSVLKVSICDAVEWQWNDFQRYPAWSSWPLHRTVGIVPLNELWMTGIGMDMSEKIAWT